jgi:hypothetical protein
VYTRAWARGINKESRLFRAALTRPPTPPPPAAGRSGRFGRKGVAINFVKNDDIRILRDIEQCVPPLPHVVVVVGAPPPIDPRRAPRSVSLSPARVVEPLGVSMLRRGPPCPRLAASATPKPKRCAPANSAWLEIWSS